MHNDRVYVPCKNGSRHTTRGDKTTLIAASPPGSLGNEDLPRALRSVVAPSLPVFLGSLTHICALARLECTRLASGCYHGGSENTSVSLGDWAKDAASMALLRSSTASLCRPRSDITTPRLLSAIASLGSMRTAMS